MSSIAKLFFSESVGGVPILVADDATPGTPIHTVPDTGDLDEIWLYAHNAGNETLALTLEVGGTTNPDNQIRVGIPPGQGLVLVLPGLVYNDVDIAAFAETADLITVSGFVNRITS